MGFDLYAAKLKDVAPPDGGYFHSSCWYWRPLWAFVCTVCEDILTPYEMERGCYNDGYRISEDKATRIAARLTHLLDQKRVREYEREYKRHLAELPQEECWLCHGTGKRTDMEVPNGCNGCLGTGKKDPVEKDYPFSEKNVKEFTEFCRNSGGFFIY